MQKYTSKETSITYKDGKLPRIYSVDIPSGASVLDYGCGKCGDYLKAAAEARGWCWDGFDPFNGKSTIDNSSYDYVLCSNVLNVIKEDEIVDEIICKCLSLARQTAIFTVWDKNRDGRGQETGKDKWQRNEKLETYLDRIKRLGFDAFKKNGVIYANNILS